ncbi:MAG TPA: hypothetical protein VFD58_18130 [Blastocatellia bacterium]|nr:hypothetical protein [Blastocatellia bacterium]
MSKYLTFTEVVFKDRELLVAALSDIGCRDIRQGESLEMGQYYSEQVLQRADIIIPRHSIGNSCGDIGFQHMEAGDYTPVIDDLDRHRALGSQLITRLRAAYNERVVGKVATRLRGTIHRTVEGGVVKIRARY